MNIVDSDKNKFDFPPEVDKACELYSSWEDIKFPIINPHNNLTINNFVYICSRCNSIISKLRGIVNFYKNFTETKIIGICPKCQIFAVLPKQRTYIDGRIVAINENGSSNEIYLQKKKSSNITFYILLSIFLILLTYFIFKR